MGKTRVCDALIIGSGITGASLAYFLARAGLEVILAERESMPGYHTTGRSAATFIPAEDNPIVRRLILASRDFLERPPAGFTETPILTPRPGLVFAGEDESEELRAWVEDLNESGVALERLDQRQALSVCPMLRPERVDEAIYFPDDRDIDVHALFSGFLAGFRAAGGSSLREATLLDAAWEKDRWRVTVGEHRVTTQVLVNAAGAWADEVASLCEVRALGLTPKRRTVIVVDPPAELAIDQWPHVSQVSSQWYFKPDAGRLLVSPGDETPSPPCDAQPEELDIAIAVDRLENATCLKVARIGSRWAGLRSFFADGLPAVGFSSTPGFFWLAGQGGFGIETSPTLARLAASLILREPLSDDIAAFGIDPVDLSPHRLSLLV